MKVAIKILRGIVIMLSFVMLAKYYLNTSDIPPVVSLKDLYTFILGDLIMIIIAIFDFLVCRKYKYRSGYFTLCCEIIVFVLWVLSYNGVNFLAGNREVNLPIMCMLFGGIISSAIQIAAQLFNLNKGNG